MKPPEGDSQYLVFRAETAEPILCCEDFAEAKTQAEEWAAEDCELYEVYAKIGQAVPIKTLPPVKWYHVESVGM